MRDALRTPVFWPATIGATIVVALVASASLIVLASRDKTLSDEMGELARLSLTLAEHTQRVIFGADLLVSSIEERIQAAGPKSPEEFQRHGATRIMYEALAERIILAPDVDALTLIDSNGKSVNSTRSWPPPTFDVSDRDYFLALRDAPGTAYFISAALKNRVTGQEAIFLARRISAPDGAFLGVVLGVIATSRFEKLFAAVLSDDNASISLHRRDGVVLSRVPQAGNAIERNPEIQRFFEETLARAEHGTLHTGPLAAGSPPRLMALHTVGGYPLFINVTNSEAAALAGWRRLSQLIFAITAAVIVLMLLLGFAFIRQLKADAQISEVTAAKATEEALRRSTAVLNEQLETRVRERTADLEGANRELETFVYSVSHDLRAPLRGIDGFARMVLEDHAAQLPPEGRRKLAVVREQTLKMGVLIDHLLELGRVGRRELSPHPVKLADLVRNCMSELRIEQEGREIEWVVGELPVWHADPILLKQLFLNLLSNALKFTREREAARIEVGAERRGAEQVVFVRDNGAGFDMAHVDKLFGAFQRLHAEGDYPGTGMGLAIVRRAAERHGARVWAEGAPDRGATFYVAFTPASAAD